MSAATPFEFRFDALAHEYIALESGEVLPHITGMLEACGLIDDTWYTEESCERGTIVHKLTADFDLGAIEDPASVESAFKAYLLAHVKAMSILRPTILGVEEPVASRTWRFAGRPDRKVIINRAKAVLEIKTCAKPERSHQIQTALQCFLLADEFELPPEAIQRFVLYLGKKGNFKVDENKDRRDFDEARRIIRRVCNR